MSTRIGPFVFDSRARQLLCDSAPVALTPKAFALLRVLVETAPAAMSREALYERLWPDVCVESGNLYTLVAEIRAAAGDESLVRTVRGFGYALGYAVEEAVPVAASLVLASRSIPLRAGENTIGRSLLLNGDVSRIHARIVLEGDSAVIEDCGSKNGTWINGVRISGPTPLGSGDAVTFGLTRALLVLGGGGTTVTGHR